MDLVCYCLATCLAEMKISKEIFLSLNQTVETTDPKEMGIPLEIPCWEKKEALTSRGACPQEEVQHSCNILSALLAR